MNLFPPLIWSRILDFLDQKSWWRLKINSRILRIINKKIAVDQYEHVSMKMQEIYLESGKLESLRWEIEKTGFFSEKLITLLYFYNYKNILLFLMKMPYFSNIENPEYLEYLSKFITEAPQVKVYTKEAFIYMSQYAWKHNVPTALNRENMIKVFMGKNLDLIKHFDKFSYNLDQLPSYLKNATPEILDYFIHKHPELRRNPDFWELLIDGAVNVNNIELFVYIDKVIPFSLLSIINSGIILCVCVESGDLPALRYFLEKYEFNFKKMRFNSMYYEFLGLNIDWIVDNENASYFGSHIKNIPIWNLK